MTVCMLLLLYTVIIKGIITYYCCILQYLQLIIISKGPSVMKLTRVLLAKGKKK